MYIISLIVRWVKVTHEALSFILIAMLVCESGNWRAHLSFLIWTSMHFSPCLEASKRTLQSMYGFVYVVVQSWCYLNKPTACQVLVCTSFHCICSIYAKTFKQLLSSPSCHFGSINHFCHQSWKLWTNSSNKALLRSWRLTLHLIICSCIINIWLNSSTNKQLTLMVCALSTHVLQMYEQFMAQQILLCFKIRRQKMMQVQI